MEGEQFYVKELTQWLWEPLGSPVLSLITEGGMHASDHKTNASEGVLTIHTNVSTRSDL